MNERRDNGLSAVGYVRLVQLTTDVADQFLDALRRARIPAYREADSRDGQVEVYVASSDRDDANSILRATVPAPAANRAAPIATDPLADIDTEAEFKALIADWDPIPETEPLWDAAVWRAADADPATEPDAEVADVDEHFVPPPPPPLPRPTAATVGAFFVLIAGIALLATGALLGLPADLTFLLGVAGILVGSGLLVMRLRDHPHFDGDDGAVV